MARGKNINGGHRHKHDVDKGQYHGGDGCEVAKSCFLCTLKDCSWYQHGNKAGKRAQRMEAISENVHLG